MRTRFDIFSHPVSTRVVGADSGKRGTVIEIKETKPEWIQPVIRWDDGTVGFVQNEEIFLEEGE